MKAYKKKISKKRVYREYVSILNGVLQLSHREADVFATLLQINAEWGSMVEQIGNVLSTDVRRQLMKETRITKTNLARYVNSLADKGILVPGKAEGSLMINDTFIPTFVETPTGHKKEISTTCNVKFVLEIVD